MNIRGILNIMGSLLMIIALAMVIPVLVGIYYHEKDAIAFIFTSGLTFLSGVLFKCINYDKKIGFQYKDGFVVVTMGWLIVSIFGGIPFILTGVLTNPIDAFFESVSGFTTTGATVIMYLENLSHTILFWRSLTHWLGGMGIIVMAIAILPELAGNMHLFKREVPGPFSDRIKPRIKDTAKTLWFIYLILTFVEIILLYLNGISLFDAVIHSFGTISTGGFSSNSLSIKLYNSLTIEIIITIFMFLAAVNFKLLYIGFSGGIKKMFRDEELRFYVLILVVTSLLIFLNLEMQMYDNTLKSLKNSVFQVVSLSSTTGFATVDYDTWPSFSRWFLLVLMFVGGCAGSTSGGIKVIRIRILFKKVTGELQRLLHPNIVKKIKVNNKVLPDVVSTNILSFFYLYITVFVIGTIILTYLGVDIISSVSAVASTLGNVGPGLKLVGPLNSYMNLPLQARFILIICMLMGRLEIYTILVFLFMEWR